MLQFIRSTFFQTLLQSLSGAVVIFNVNGTVYSANDAASTLLGVPRENMLHKSLSELFGTASADPDLSEFLRLAPDPAVCLLPITIALPQAGRLRMLSLSRSLLVDYGKVFGVILQITDLTSLYELHEKERAILEQGREMERRRVEGLRSLAMSLAHQIRNPLTVIGGYSSMLLRSRVEGPDRDRLSAILDSGRRLERLVSVLTEYCGLRAETKARHDAAGLAREAWSMAGALPELGEGTLLGMEGRTVRADRRLAVKALAEVVKNAAQAAAGDRLEVEFRAVPNGEGVRVEIADRGVGVDPAHLPHLFDPFFTTRPEAVGMGLCLAEKAMAARSRRPAAISKPPHHAWVASAHNCNLIVALASCNSSRPGLSWKQKEWRGRVARPIHPLQGGLRCCREARMCNALSCH